VDGGVNERTVLSLIRAGANVLVVGRAIYGKKPITKKQFTFLKT